MVTTFKTFILSKHEVFFSHNIPPYSFHFLSFSRFNRKKINRFFFRVGENLYNERVNSFQKIKEADLALKPLIWY